MHVPDPLRRVHLRTPPTVGGVLVVVLLGVGALIAPVLGPYTLFVLALVVVQVIAVLSLNLLMGYAGQISLGQAALVGVGAYGTAQLAEWSLPFPATLLAAALVTAAVATVVGLPSLRIRGLHLAAVTLSFGLAAGLLFARPWDPAATMGVTIPRPGIVLDDARFLALCLGVLVLVLAVDASVRRSRIGRAFLAVRDREDTAAARGIPVGTTKLLAYALSGLYAGLAGGLYAYLLERLTSSPFDVWSSLGYVAAVVVGGLGSWSGAAVAATAFNALPELLRPAATLAPLAGAVLLMLMPVLRPEGLGWLLDRRLWHPRRQATLPPPEPPRPPPRPLSLSVPVRTLLEVDELHVHFGGLRVLTGTSLTIHRGELLGLLGPNGAGKTTLFNAMSGFVQPQQGAIRFRGRDVLATPPHARPAMGIGRTFQQMGLCDGQTVLANVLLAQHTVARYGVLPALVRTPAVRSHERTLQSRARAALEAVGILELTDERVRDLPFASQRLVEIAAVLAAGPELLLLDEPAAGTSPEDARLLGKRLRDLCDRLGVTIVLIEHHVPLVVEVSDRVAVLAEGRLLTEGPPAQVQADPRVAAVYLGTDSAEHETEEVVTGA